MADSSFIMKWTRAVRPKARPKRPEEAWPKGFTIGPLMAWFMAFWTYRCGLDDHASGYGFDLELT